MKSAASRSWQERYISLSKKKIILHGYLKEKYPHPIEVEATTVAEAMRSLEQIEELQPENGEPHPVYIQGVDSEFALYSHTQMEEIHVHPHTGGGGGRNGLLQVLIGVALIAIGIWNPAFLASTGLISQSSLFLAGGLMVAGGLLQMLAPKPDDADERTSNYLNAQGNTVAIGTPIPTGYGTAKIGGHFLSFDVDAVNVSDGPLGNLLSSVSQAVLSQYDDPAYIAALEADAVADGDGTGDVSTESPYGSFFTEIDKTPVPLAVVCPVYASQTPSPANVPTSAWID